MTVDELVTESALHTTGRPKGTPAEAIESLRELAEFLLSSIDYERQKSSAPAGVARAIASVIYNLQHGRAAS